MTNKNITIKVEIEIEFDDTQLDEKGIPSNILEIVNDHSEGLFYIQNIKVIP